MVPTAQERAAVIAGSRALILLRVQCAVDDQPFGPCVFRSRFRIQSDNAFVGFAMGSFETFGEPANLEVRALSEESFEAGWVPFVLTPGIHYLYVRRYDSNFTSRSEALDYYSKSFRDRPLWRIDVPDHSKLIYAGTLLVSGKTRGTLLFGDKIIDPIGTQALPLSDDRASAARLLSDVFPEAGDVQTVPMQRWSLDDPFIFRSPLPESRTKEPKKMNSERKR